MDPFDTGEFPSVIVHCLSKEYIVFLEVTVTL